MLIKIRNDLYPFSHSFGKTLLITNTNYTLQVFPSMLIFKEINKDKEFKIHFDINGPIKNFLVMQDLKKGIVKISFFTKDDFISYKIFTFDSTKIFFEKIHSNSLDLKINTTSKKVKSKSTIELPIEITSNEKIIEKLSFGSHKKQDIDLIKRREDIKEIFPFIFSLSQFFKCEKKYTSQIFKSIEKKIKNKDKLNLEEDFLNICKSFFFDFFTPRIFHFDYQNIFKENFGKIDPIIILKEFSRLLRNTLILEEKENVNILPLLMKEFFCGRFINVNLNFAIIDIEWSKKLIKKMIVKPKVDKKIHFKFQSKIDTFRVRSFLKEKGKVHKNNDLFFLEKNKTYFFDRFQK
ncbi:MAG: hypothetical protein K1060chlam5_00857 [Candidatus Anoxychlamydiales bacterium]|nr:hypothetical protein [Candidatus Anoxychlamydiales bacterium]